MLFKPHNNPDHKNLKYYWQLHYAYYMPHAILSPLYILTHLILTIILKEKE